MDSVAVAVVAAAAAVDGEDSHSAFPEVLLDEVAAAAAEYAGYAC
jgi:hypothetical protein